MHDMSSRKCSDQLGRASTICAKREPGWAAPGKLPSRERCRSMCARSRLNREHASAAAVARIACT